MNDTKNPVRGIIIRIIREKKLLSLGVAAAVAGSTVVSLLPPLVLADIVDELTAGNMIRFRAVLYFGLLALAGLIESGRESLLAVLGQKITHGLRTAMSEKLTRLSAESLNGQESGAVVSRFVGDTDTVEELFSSGIISMFADLCKIISILVIIFNKNKGLSIILCIAVPVIYIFTRRVQKKMLKANVDNRAAIARVTGHVPETIRNIRTIHTLNKEEFMKKTYDRYIGESYGAVERTNFYDSVYSPVILIFNALVVSAVMLMSASGNKSILVLFGMSVGTAVAVINYISQIFGPIESLGMEIQTIQSAVAGVKRINEFLNLPEKWQVSEVTQVKQTADMVVFDGVSFGYGEKKVIDNLSFTVHDGEQVTLTGRTGAGKSTIFKLLLGLYRVQEGKILICGQQADEIPDMDKRKLFGYVDQNFHTVPGTVYDQIALFDEDITREMVIEAAKIAGIHETIEAMDEGYDTPCTGSVFSQGQWQLLAIARAVAGRPKILLLDEITANLDAQTEAALLTAITNASKDRTVLSISHRLYRNMGGRQITVGE